MSQKIQESDPDESLEAALAAARACTVCRDELPHEPRPVVRMEGTAGILLIGQAPGRRVHESGIPWNDPSGDRLREWMQVSSEVFYDSAKIAIMPMGFCYPGTEKGADLPPRKECAPAWHDRLLPHLKHVRVTILIGSYAQARYLAHRKPTMTETVRNWRETQPETWVLPHPSWRNTAWMKKNPWFESELLPVFRQQVQYALAAAESADC
ncbi:MAG: uracil-DNA glycosylase family protein [Pseudomonadota bacterium]